MFEYEFIQLEHHLNGQLREFPHPHQMMDVNTPDLSEAGVKHRLLSTHYDKYPILQLSGWISKYVTRIMALRHTKVAYLTMVRCYFLQRNPIAHGWQFENYLFTLANHDNLFFFWHGPNKIEFRLKKKVIPFDPKNFRDAEFSPDACMMPKDCNQEGYDADILNEKTLFFIQMTARRSPHPLKLAEMGVLVSRLMNSRREIEKVDILFVFPASDHGYSKTVGTVSGARKFHTATKPLGTSEQWPTSENDIKQRVKLCTMNF
jgi:hypothetical protein